MLTDQPAMEKMTSNLMKNYLSCYEHFGGQNTVEMMKAK